MKLLLEGIIKFLLGVILVGLLIFIPAGTIKYFNGLLFMGILFIPMFIAGIIMFFTNKKLLESRLNNKEKENTQKAVILISGLMFISGFVVAGLNYRFSWFILPNIISIVASIIFIIFYILYAEVLRENTYLSRTVEVVSNQKVIDTGLYGIVRHPMYIVTIMMFLMIPLILGDIFSLFIFLIYPILIIVRINNEEKVLEKELKGYTEYKKKVKYRLIPFIY
jgi:protein-S-isoprenylcysteine O-methyltransferase Ste14